jgi:hypothetical protein
MAIFIGLQFKFFVSEIFPKQTYKGTRMNKVVKFFLKRIVEPAFPMITTTLFYAQSIGNGNAFPVVPLTAVAAANHGVTITWNPLDYPPGAPTTGVMCCVGLSLQRGLIGYDYNQAAFSNGVAHFFAGSSPFITGDHCIFALGQTYVDPVTGLTDYSKLTYESIVTTVVMT